MSWVRVPKSEFDRIRKLASEKKAKREEKRKSMPWGKARLIWTPPGTELAAMELIKATKSRRPRRKKTLVEIAWDRNDSLWSELVRRRDMKLYGPRCRICGRIRQRVGYHIIPKKRGVAIRWLPENGVAACINCNYGERQNPGLYRDKHIALLGEDRVEAIEAIARPGTHFDLEDLQDIGAWLKATTEAAPGKGPPRPPCLPMLGGL